MGILLYFWRRWKCYFGRKIEQLFFNQYFYWIFSKINLRQMWNQILFLLAETIFIIYIIKRVCYVLNFMVFYECLWSNNNKRFLNKEIVKTFSKSLKGIINSTRSIEKRSVVYKINCRGTVITWSSQRDLPHDFSFCC